MPGPYFPDQRPSQCGHYYPDVLRLRDERRPDGTLVRIVDCSYCGRIEYPLEERHLSPELARKLKTTGREVAIRDDEIATVRKAHLEEVLSTSEKTGKLTLRSLIDKGVRQEVDAIELEYVPAGLEVTYFSGPIGIGEVIDDRESANSIISELISQAKLEHRSRGVFKWVHEAQEYEIRAEQYESFGESSFRLILKKPKQRT